MKLPTWLCTLLGHRSQEAREETGIELPQGALVNLLTRCPRCGLEEPSGVVLRTPDGQEHPILARAADGTQGHVLQARRPHE